MPVCPTYPGVYIEEVPSKVHTINGVSTADTAFVDCFCRGPMKESVRITSLAEFRSVFGGVDAHSEGSYAIWQYYLNGGQLARVVRVAPGQRTNRPSAETLAEGLDVLGRDGGDLNLLCLPAAALLSAGTDQWQLLSAAAALCEERRAFLLIDPPPQRTMDNVLQWVEQGGFRHRNAALYFPRLLVDDPVQQKIRRNVGASGAMAGVYARTDITGGVWKAPAGGDAVLRGAMLAEELSSAEGDALNRMGINVVRPIPPSGVVAWGARTLDGADAGASEWKYVAVRRLFVYLEASLLRGLQWVVFEPNSESLWNEIRLRTETFLGGLFNQGAFQGATPNEAYFVHCDATTMTGADIENGQVHVVVGFAPAKPSEFVILRLGLWAKGEHRRC